MSAPQSVTARKSFFESRRFGELAPLSKVVVYGLLLVWTVVVLFPLYWVLNLTVVPVAHVVYRGTAMTRDPANPAGIMDELVTDPAKATVLGAAVRPDGTTFPWAVRSGNLTYVGEVPLSYRSPTDRSLAFADLIFDVLAPDRAPRHAALLSQHDVGQDADPARLRAVVSELYPVPPPAQPRR